jgi:hypothetical protein
MEVEVRSWPVDVVVEKRVIRLYVDAVWRGGGPPFHGLHCPHLCALSDRCGAERPHCAMRASAFIVPTGGDYRVFFSWEKARRYAARMARGLRPPLDP